MTAASLDAQFDQPALLEQLAFTCTQPVFTNATALAAALSSSASPQQRANATRDLSPLCFDLLNGVGDMAADLMWTQWSRQADGTLSQIICSILSTC